MTYIPLIIALLGWIPALLALWRQSKKDKVDIGSILIGDAIKLKDEIIKQKEETDKEINSIKKALKELRKKVLYLRQGIDVLISQIEGMGKIPAWRPDLTMEESDIEEA